MRLSLTEMVHASLQPTPNDPLYTHQQLPRFGLNALPPSSPSPVISHRDRYKTSKCPQSPEPEKPIRRRKRGNTAGTLHNGQEKVGNIPFFICTGNSLDLQSLKETLRLEPRCKNCRSVLCRCAKAVKDAELRKIQGRIRRRKGGNTLGNSLPEPSHPSSRVQTAASSLRQSYRAPQTLLRPYKPPASPSPLLAALSVFRAEMSARGTRRD